MKLSQILTALSFLKNVDVKYNSILLIKKELPASHPRQSIDKQILISALEQQLESITSGEADRFELLEQDDQLANFYDHVYNVPLSIRKDKLIYSHPYCKERLRLILNSGKNPKIIIHDTN